MVALELDVEKQYDGLLGAKTVLSSEELESDSQRVDGVNDTVREPEAVFWIIVHALHPCSLSTSKIHISMWR